MTISELKTVCEILCEQGYGKELVVYRDENTEPDLDVANAYYDEEAGRLIVRGYDF